MKKIEILSYIIIGVTIITGIVTSILYYLIGFSKELLWIPGLLIGMGLGVGIGWLIIVIRRTKRWQDNARWIKHIILRIWEGVILSFTIFYMFPHFLNYVINNVHNIFQASSIWGAFYDDINKYWYIYTLFFFILWVWILLLVRYEHDTNKREKQSEFKVTKLTKLVTKLFKGNRSIRRIS